MIEVIKITFNDDAVSSKSIEVMFCSSSKEAKQNILNDINNDFDEKWDTLEDAESALVDDLFFCEYDGSVFEWHDNGKGVCYTIGDVEVQKKGFSHFDAIIW